MDVEINIEKERLKPKVVIHTNEVTSEINELVKRLTDYNEQLLIGYRNEEVILLNPDEIYRIYSQGQKVVARTLSETVFLKFRLYELEEKLSGSRLIRISNSEIVNLKRIKSLDLSITGTITMKFDNGEKSFVSRRYVERIKQYIGIS
ncbi:MAG: LytTR family transcriptional regulator [Herbinix sp.]|jgi:DNA-binding LytR/AlgR family response regulator|nr:LytTR family transcriptional regulator [Herbinix sp.]